MTKWFAAFFLLFAAAGMFGGTLSAVAQTRGNGSEWCLQEKGRGSRGFAADCSFKTLAQCQESATGNVGSCSRNPYYKRR